MSNDRLKFRAWDDKNLCWVRPKMVENESGVTVDERGYDLAMWTMLYDLKLQELYEFDVVYIAGYGNYVCEYPFETLFDAWAEGDVGEKLGNIYESPELDSDA